MCRFKVVHKTSQGVWVYDTWDMNCALIGDSEFQSLLDKGYTFEYLDEWDSSENKYEFIAPKLNLLYPAVNFIISKIGVLTALSGDYDGAIYINGVRGIFLTRSVEFNSVTIILDDSIDFVTCSRHTYIFANLTFDISRVTRHDLLYQVYLLRAKKACLIKGGSGLVSTLYSPVAYMFTCSKSQVNMALLRMFDKASDDLFEKVFSDYIHNSYTVEVVHPISKVYKYKMGVNFMGSTKDWDENVEDFLKELYSYMYEDDFALVLPLLLYVVQKGRNDIINKRVNNFLDFLDSGGVGEVVV